MEKLNDRNFTKALGSDEKLSRSKVKNWKAYFYKKTRSEKPSEFYKRVSLFLKKLAK